MDEGQQQYQIIMVMVKKIICCKMVIVKYMVGDDVSLEEPEMEDNIEEVHTVRDL